MHVTQGAAQQSATQPCAPGMRTGRFAPLLTASRAWLRELARVCKRDGGCSRAPERTPNFGKLTKAFAVIDSEWTDGAPATARIVSLAITRHEPDGRAKSGYWLVDPLAPISAEATAVHGIRNEDVAGKPAFRDVAPQVAAMLAGCDIGGYGVRGDIQVIELELERAGVRWSPNGAAIVDGLRMWQVREPRRLEDAYRRFVGALPAHGTAHHAAFDAELAGAVIAALREERSIAQIHEETNGQMVDVGGKFQRDQGARTVFAFGPYRGAVATEHPEYLQWMLGKDFPPSTLDIARQLLEEYEREQAALDAQHPDRCACQPGASTDDGDDDDGEPPF